MLGRTEEDHRNRPQRARLALPGTGGRGAVGGARVHAHRPRGAEPPGDEPRDPAAPPDTRRRRRQPPGCSRVAPRHGRARGRGRRRAGSPYVRAGRAEPAGVPADRVRALQSRSRTPAATRASCSRCSTVARMASSSAASTRARPRASTRRRCRPASPTGPCPTRRARPSISRDRHRGADDGGCRRPARGGRADGVAGAAADGDRRGGSTSGSTSAATSASVGSPGPR